MPEFPRPFRDEQNEGLKRGAEKFGSAAPVVKPVDRVADDKKKELRNGISDDPALQWAKLDVGERGRLLVEVGGAALSGMTGRDFSALPNVAAKKIGDILSSRKNAGNGKRAAYHFQTEAEARKQLEETKARGHKILSGVEKKGNTYGFEYEGMDRENDDAGKDSIVADAKKMKGAGYGESKVVSELLKDYPNANRSKVEAIVNAVFRGSYDNDDGAISSVSTGFDSAQKTTTAERSDFVEGLENAGKWEPVHIGADHKSIAEGWYPKQDGKIDDRDWFATESECRGECERMNKELKNAFSDSPAMKAARAKVDALREKEKAAGGRKDGSPESNALVEALKELSAVQKKEIGESGLSNSDADFCKECAIAGFDTELRPDGFCDRCKKKTGAAKGEKGPDGMRNSDENGLSEFHSQCQACGHLSPLDWAGKCEGCFVEYDGEKNGMRVNGLAPEQGEPWTKQLYEQEDEGTGATGNPDVIKEGPGLENGSAECNSCHQPMTADGKGGWTGHKDECPLGGMKSAVKNSTSTEGKWSKMSLAEREAFLRKIVVPVSYAKNEWAQLSDIAKQNISDVMEGRDNSDEEENCNSDEKKNSSQTAKADESWDVASEEERGGWLITASQDVSLARFAWPELSLDVQNALRLVWDSPEDPEMLVAERENSGGLCICGHSHDGDVCDDCSCRIFSPKDRENASDWAKCPECIFANAPATVAKHLEVKHGYSAVEAKKASEAEHAQFGKDSHFKNDGDASVPEELEEIEERAEAIGHDVEEIEEKSEGELENSEFIQTPAECEKTQEGHRYQRADGRCVFCGASSSLKNAAFHPGDLVSVKGKPDVRGKILKQNPSGMYQVKMEMTGMDFPYHESDLELKNASDRPITQDDMNASARGNNMLSMSVPELRDLIASMEGKDMFAAKVTVAAAKQMLAAKRRMGAAENEVENAEEIKCPKCGSANIKKPVTSVITCYDCGKWSHRPGAGEPIVEQRNDDNESEASALENSTWNGLERGSAKYGKQK